MFAKVSIVFFPIFFFVSNICSATEISVVTDGKADVRKVVKVAEDGIYNLRIKAIADGDAKADTQSEACISVTGKAGSETVSGWGHRTQLWHKDDWGGFDLKLTNHCNYKINRYLGVWHVSGTPSRWIGDWFEVPAQKSCSATVNDVNIAKAFAGESSALTLPVAKAGRGSVTFDSDDLGLSGILNLGKSSQVTLKPSDARFINAEGKWISGFNQNDIPLLLDVERGAASGEYKSVMTATLVCE